MCGVWGYPLEWSLFWNIILLVGYVGYAVFPPNNYIITSIIVVCPTSSSNSFYAITITNSWSLSLLWLLTDSLSSCTTFILSPPLSTQSSSSIETWLLLCTQAPPDAGWHSPICIQHTEERRCQKTIGKDVKVMIMMMMLMMLMMMVMVRLFWLIDATISCNHDECWFGDTGDGNRIFYWM